MIPFFPGGLAGAGLITLRISAAASLLMLVAGTWPGSAALLALAGATALILGVQTRVVAALSVLGTLSGFDDGAHTLAIVHALDVAALALLGPGALSVDAALFGRQRLKLPNADTTSR